MELMYGRDLSEHISSRPGYNGTSILSYALRFGTDQACFEHLWQVRYSDGLVCPACGQSGQWQKNWETQHVQHVCTHVVSPLADTLVHKTTIPLSLWFYALLHFANCAEGIETTFLARQLGLSIPKARRVMAQIRLHIAALQSKDKPCGDQTEIFVRLETLVQVPNLEPHKGNKTHIFFIAAGGKVDASVVEDPRRADLGALIRQKAPRARIIRTTCKRTARILGVYNHTLADVFLDPDHFRRKSAQTDAIAGFKSYILPALKNREERVLKHQLWLYLKEFEFRYNRRNRSQNTYWDMVGDFPTLGEAEIEALRAHNHLRASRL
ncbi:MAG: hypothetical protein WBA51_08735 [Erythrobacter sp.]